MILMDSFNNSFWNPWEQPELDFPDQIMARSTTTASGNYDGVNLNVEDENTELSLSLPQPIGKLEMIPETFKTRPSLSWKQPELETDQDSLDQKADSCITTTSTTDTMPSGSGYRFLLTYEVLLSRNSQSMKDHKMVWNSLHNPLWLPWMQLEHRTRLDQMEQMSQLHKEVKALNRKKDVVCLLLSYPPMNSMTNKERHKNWIRDVLNMNDKVRRARGSTENAFPELLSETTELQKHSLSDIEAHIPSMIIEKMCSEIKPTTLADGKIRNLACTIANGRKPKTVPPDEKLHRLAIKCAARQVREEIVNPDVLRIRIFGRDGERMVSAVKELPRVRQMFDIVIQVHSLPFGSIKDIKEKIATQLGFSLNLQRLNRCLRTKNFLIFLHLPLELIDVFELGSKWWSTNHIQKIVCVTDYYLQRDDQGLTMDLEVRLEDHMLSWELFCFSSGKIEHFSSSSSSSSVQVRRRAIRVVKKCSGHLLPVALTARALKMVFQVWLSECASSNSRPWTVDRVLCNTLDFILGRSVSDSGSADECLDYCAFYMDKDEGVEKVDLIQDWISHSLISTFDEGDKIFGDLVSSLLLERLENGSSVRMRDEIRQLLVNPLFLCKGGKGLTKAPRDEAWEQALEIYLMNNKFSRLPNTPKCPHLSILFLQNNPFLRAIPPSFFQHMPVLQVLDLSRTRIRLLPQSLYQLVHLQRLLLRGCKLLMELPPEIGKLKNLKVLDFEGTEIVRLPVEVGNLTNLTCLKMSFYGDGDEYDRKDDHDQTYSDRIIPHNVLSSLLQLEELTLDVSPDDKRWDANVKDIVEEVCCLDRLSTLQIYLPEVLLFYELCNTSASVNLSGLRHFKFTIGSHMKRIISRVPLEIAAKFGEQEKCLKYVNGEGLPIELQDVLQQATALFLDRHSTATSLSAFRVGTMKNLKFCVLAECDEIEAIVGENVNRLFSLESLEYLNVYYMKNLKSLWKGEIQWRSLSCLKVLGLYTCPQLTTIFTENMISSLHNLEELLVDDCPKIESLMDIDSPNVVNRMLTFPKLKRISLHHLLKLVSIFKGLIISPMLEWMSVYDCPSLKTLYPEEVHSKVLRTIIGEEKWWEELRWNVSERFGPPNLDAIFFPIVEWDDKDLTTRLAEINIQHQARMQETELSRQGSSSRTYLRAPALEDRTRSKQKQVA